MRAPVFVCACTKAHRDRGILSHGIPAVNGGKNFINMHLWIPGGVPARKAWCIHKFLLLARSACIGLAFPACCGYHD
jgi:hypothetical protein